MERMDPLVERFFDGKGAAPPGRQRLTVGNVPATEEGLRQLSQCGSWHAVASLAERLEHQHLEGGQPTVQSLRFSVCRATAYVKLQQYTSARRLFDNLGDLFQLASSLSVPYTLHYLAAILPGLSGDLRGAQMRLYQLLAWTLKQKSLNEGAAEWVERAKRCRRAIVVNHFELGQFAPSLQTMRELAESEEHSEPVNRLLAYHQFGCLCLHSGNSFLGRDVFKMVEKFPVEGPGVDPSVVELKALLTQLNHALLLIFHGYFSEASNTLRLLTNAAPSPPPLQEGGAALHEGSKELVNSFRKYVQLSAQSSLATCVCFLHRNDTDLSGTTSSSTVSSMIDALERTVREEPYTALKCDALLYCLGRAYEMEGTTQQRMDTVDALLETYRGNKEAAPQLKR